MIRGAVLVCGLSFAPVVVPGPAQSNLPESLAGTTVDPLKLSEGQVVVMLFVRTDCPISNRYAPTIQHLSEKFRGRANFWLVYPDAAESAARISPRSSMLLKSRFSAFGRQQTLGRRTITRDRGVCESGKPVSRQNR
jgi:thiol-disulfide isomerase/thioredoxin